MMSLRVFYYLLLTTPMSSLEPAFFRPACLISCILPLFLPRSFRDIKNEQLKENGKIHMLE